VDEVADSIKPVAVANVDEDVVAEGEQRLRRQASEAVSRAGNEDARHQNALAVGLPRERRQAAV
jgi:hypothetical protein